MKLKFTLSMLSACLLMIPAAAVAAEKKAKAENPPASAPAKPVAAKGDKAMPMNARVDMIDASAKTFTMKRKDGVEIKNTVTDETEIMQDGKPAKFADIKVGDMVAGLRMKKSDTEYEVVKVTKFGPKAPKPAKEKKAPAGEEATKAGQ